MTYCYEKVCINNLDQFYFWLTKVKEYEELKNVNSYDSNVIYNDIVEVLYDNNLDWLSYSTKNDFPVFTSKLQVEIFELLIKHVTKGVSMYNVINNIEKALTKALDLVAEKN